MYNIPSLSFTAAEDLLQLIAKIQAQTQVANVRCRVPRIVTIVHDDDDRISDISASDGEDVNESDNSMRQKTNPPVLDTGNSKFREEFEASYS